ncbi:condensation domain-containing protein [Streptomyces lavendofoliae]|uniref:condensation domain-containing protein n=1 Tax=Streptomyces lavendofoliae TaxID=67314 RepID=UPI003D8E785D
MTSDSPTASALALQAELLRRARTRAGGRSAAPEAPGAPASTAPAATGTTGTTGTTGAAGAAGARRESHGAAPLSHAQRRMWLMDRLGHRDASYSVPFATRLRGRLDVDALGTALTALVRRHEILRTRYGQRDGEPFQEALPAPGAIEARLVEADPGRAPGLLAEEARRPFDLSAGPLPRLLVLRHGAEDHTVLLTFHHIAVDGASLEVVARDLARLYTAALGGTDPEPPTAPLRYADFARREHEAAGRFEEGLRHWTARLAGASAPALPRPVRPPADAAARPARALTLPLGPRVPAALRDLGASHRATLFTVALAASFAALHRLTGEDDLLIGVAGTHRRGSGMRDLVGLCVNTLPVRVDVSGDPAFAVLVQRVRDALLEAQSHRDVPFDLVVERLGAAARDADGTALVRVTADVVAEPTVLRLPGTEAEYVDVAVGAAKFDLSLGLLDTAAPAALVQYSRTALDEPAAEALAGGFAALLTAVAADPGLRLSRLPATAPTAPAHTAAQAGPSASSVASDSSALSAPAPGPDRSGPRGDLAGGRGGDDAAEHPAQALLRAHPQVTDAVVVEPAGGPLLAYAVTGGIGGPSRAELLSVLRASLPAELVPVTVTPLDAVPRTAQGAPDLARLPGLPSVPAPAGPRAEAVTGAFAAVLGCPAPGPDDDFFVLGGHSLAAVRLAERLRGALRLPLTGLDVMQARTPRAVVALLDGRAEERAAVAAAPTRRARPRGRGRGRSW